MPHDEVYPLRLAPQATSDASSPFDVLTERVEPGWHWLVTHFGVEDETTAFTSVRVFVESGEFPYPLAEQISPVAANLYHGETRQILGEHDRIGARFVGSTNGDLLRVYVHGWMLPPGVVVTAALVGALVGAGPLGGGTSHLGETREEG